MQSPSQCRRQCSLSPIWEQILGSYQLSSFSWQRTFNSAISFLFTFSRQRTFFLCRNSTNFNPTMQSPILGAEIPSVLFQLSSSNVPSLSELGRFSFLAISQPRFFNNDFPKMFRNVELSNNFRIHIPLSSNSARQSVDFPTSLSQRNSLRISILVISQPRFLRNVGMFK